MIKFNHVAPIWKTFTIDATLKVFLNSNKFLEESNKTECNYIFEWFLWLNYEETRLLKQRFNMDYVVRMLQNDE
jgi:hypothetical protein